MSMVKLRSLATDSLCRQIRDAQADSNGGEVAARYFWCLCIGFWCGGGSLFLPPLFCEIVGFFDRIPHGDGDKVLLAAVRQLVVANDFSSPFLIKMVALHSTLIMGLGVKSCSIFNV
jgi:hypothetical protein